MLTGRLAVSVDAVSGLVASMPVLATGGWTVHGKTGMAYQRGADGAPDRNLARAWFIGWAERGARTVAFARYAEAPDTGQAPLWLMLRDAILVDLPGPTGGNGE